MTDEKDLRKVLAFPPGSCDNSEPRAHGASVARYACEGEHVVCRLNGHTYNFHVVWMPGKVGRCRDFIFVDRNGPPFRQSVFPSACATSLEALRVIMDGATEEHVAAAWEAICDLSKG